MTQEELQKLLTSFEQQVGNIKEWQIDRAVRLKIQSSDAGKSRGKQLKTQKDYLKQIGKKGNDATKKIVLRYDLNGNFINQYDSTVLAALDNNCKSSNISNACNNKENVRTLNGFIFRFKKGDIENKIEVDLSRPTAVCEFCNKKATTSNIKRWHGDNCKHKQ